MNTSTRTRFAAIASAFAIFAFGACGTEISPPAQDIDRGNIEKQDRGPSPKRTTGNRLQFGDESGTAKTRERKTRPAGSGTRNRMDFGEYDGQ